MMSESEFDSNVGSTCLRVLDETGQEHRIEAITERALDLMAQRLPVHLAHELEIENLAIGPIQFGTMSDDEAASQIAEAILEALALKLNV
jgi:hypothetical protein